jgi:GWxTD domain-containing protein
MSPLNLLRVLKLSPTLWVLPAICAVLASPARAQSPAERAAIEAFRDSVAGTQDSTGLLVLERKLIEQAKADRSNVMLHLRLGFLAMRLGELTNPSHFDDAASEFQWAIDLQPQWPYPWYGMGLAELALGDSKVTLVAGLQTMFGKDAMTRAATAYARSAEVDPSFVKGLVELANTALAQRVNIKLAVALEALRRSADTEAGENPEVLLARGRIEREAGDVDSAVVAFRELVEKHKTPLAQLELARTEFLAGNPKATTGYIEAAASGDSAVVRIIRRDLTPIASDSILGEFDALAGPYRAAWLKRFWEERDDLSLRAPGERLTEHYRRWFYARKNFALVSTLRRRYDIAERYRSGSTDFDDRGVIYVRHGAPTSRAFFTGTTERLDPNESWMYERTDGDIFFHFVAREDVQDFRLVESVLDVLGYSRAVQVQSAGMNSDPSAEQLIISRQGFAPIYQRMLNTSGGGTSFQRIAADERGLGRQSIAWGTTTDSWERRFPNELNGRCQVVGVGSDSLRSLLQVACAVRAGSVTPVQVPQGLLYQLRLYFTATDSTGHVVARVDTTRRFLATSPIPESESIVSLVTVPAAGSGLLYYRFLLQQNDSTGQVSPLASVVVPPAQTIRLTLSDLVLGARNMRVAWRPTPADTVFFNPLTTFRRNETLELFYEVLGADPFQPHTTTLVVRKGGGDGAGYMRGQSGGGSAQVTFKFEDQSPRGRWAVQRSVNLEKLKPGDYTLEITIQSANGMKDVRRRAFRVVG